MDTVTIFCGEKTRYFQFGTALSTTAIASSNAIYKEKVYASFQAIVTGTGAVGSTIVIEVSNEDATGQGTNSNWVTYGTITLSGTTTATDGFTTASAWRWVRARVSAISGTGATVQVLMGI